MPFNDFAVIRRLRAATLPTALLATALPAQGVVPRGEDASTVPAGVVRARLLPTWTRIADRWIVRDGERALIPFGGELASDSLGTREVPSFSPTESLIRSLSGRTDFRLNVGRAVAAANARRLTIPIAIEYGVTDRLTVGVTVPVVQSRTRFSYALNADATTATGDLPYNVGVAPAANPNRDVLLGNLDRAIVRIEGCIAAPTSCGTFDVGTATTMLQSLVATRAGIRDLYGTGTTAGQRLVPLAGGSVQQQIDARLDALSAQTVALLGQTFALAGRPAGAAGPAGSRLLDDLFTSAGYDSIGQVSRLGLGDVELGAKLRVVDTRTIGADSVARGVRLAVAGLVRLGTGSSALDSPYGSGTGDGQMDLEGAAFVDAALARRFAITGAARYTVQTGEAESWFPAVAGGIDLFAPTRARAQLGDLLTLEIIPRFLISRPFSLDAYYVLARRGAESYVQVLPSESAQPSAEPVTLDAATVHHGGLGLSYSTLESWTQGRASLPVDLVVSHVRALASSGAAPRPAQTQIQLRVYYRLFGR